MTKIFPNGVNSSVLKGIQPTGKVSNTLWTKKERRLRIKNIKVTKDNQRIQYKDA